MADGDLSRLSRDIRAAGKSAAPFVRKAVEVTARKVKDAARKDYSGAQNLPGAARSISYEIGGGGGIRGGEIDAEIGPVLGGQGSIVGLVDEGTPRAAGKKRLPKALADNADDFEAGLSKAIDDALRESGL